MVYKVIKVPSNDIIIRTNLLSEAIDCIFAQDDFEDGETFCLFSQQKTGDQFLMSLDREHSASMHLNYNPLVFDLQDVVHT